MLREIMDGHQQKAEVDYFKTINNLEITWNESYILVCHSAQPEDQPRFETTAYGRYLLSRNPPLQRFRLQITDPLLL